MKRHRRAGCCCARWFTFSLTRGTWRNWAVINANLCFFPRCDRLNCRVHWWNTQASPPRLFLRKKISTPALSGSERCGGERSCTRPWTFHCTAVFVLGDANIVQSYAGLDFILVVINFRNIVIYDQSELTFYYLIKMRWNRRISNKNLKHIPFDILSVYCCSHEPEFFFCFQPLAGRWCHADV